ncbi:MAG: FKBP-type peptidyl-prolyl cis-trans isomerase [Bacteroidales bacterium]|nr:FKBP-type peptidyl-prolyl cis-trans isomerase [Bacteroidales bacterium]
MKRALTYAYICLLAAVVLLVSCEKDTDTIFANQEKAIDSYVTSFLNANPDTKVIYKNKVVRLVVQEGTGLDSLSSKGKLTVNYAGYAFSGGISKNSLFATNHEATAQDAGWSLSGEGLYEPVQIDMGSDELVDGLKRGLEGVKAGEECLILIPGKYGFGKRKIGTIPANSALAYYVWVLSLDE